MMQSELKSFLLKGRHAPDFFCMPGMTRMYAIYISPAFWIFWRSATSVGKNCMLFPEDKLAGQLCTDTNIVVISRLAVRVVII